MTNQIICNHPGDYSPDCPNHFAFERDLDTECLKSRNPHAGACSGPLMVHYSTNTGDPSTYCDKHYMELLRILDEIRCDYWTNEPEDY